jgi:uncharacterized membrane protein
MPFSPLHLLVFLVLLVSLVAFIHVGALTIAFEKLGLAPHSALALFLLSFVGSAVNLPLFTVRSDPPPSQVVPPWFRGLLRHSLREFEGKTLIAINVGGALVPAFFSLYLFRTAPLDPALTAFAIAVVSVVCYVVSRPVPGIGIGMPVFVAPLTAAAVAILLDGDRAPALAYVCGTLGVLIGADILRLRDIPRMGAPIASIGGAGTFDGIFITGIVAVLLA